MKFIILFLFSVNCFASVAWFPLGKDGANMNYVEKSLCEETEGQICYDLGECPIHLCELVDDYVIAYVSRKQYETCESEEDCDEKFSRISCIEGEEIKNYDTMSVYCAVNVMRAEGKKLVESPRKKAAYEAAKELLTIEVQTKIQRKVEARERIKTFVPKGITPEELQQEFKSFANDIKEVIE
jgi:hypothetical protein